MRRLHVALVAVAVAAAAWLLSGSSRSAPAEEVPAREFARTVLVAPGRVEPVRAPVKLSFDAQGRITSIDVEEGDGVHAGQVVARLDDRTARARLTAAEAGLAQAKARFEFIRRGPRREDLRAARAEARAASATAAHRRAERARSDKLGKAGVVAIAAVDADRTAARVANALSNAARARYQSLAKGARAETIAEAAAAIELALAEVEAAKVALDQTVLRAPSDGVILRRTAEVGMLVTMPDPMPVVTMADLRELEVRAEIDEADVAAIVRGQTAYATTEAHGDRKFPVRIARITHELGRKMVRDDDPRARVDTRVLEVIGRFEETSPGLPIGLRMTVHIELVGKFDELHRTPFPAPTTITFGETK